jgi:hypothetical protein
MGLWALRFNIRSFSTITLLTSVIIIGLVFPTLVSALYYYPTCTVTAMANYPGAATITPGNGTYGYGSFVVFYETTNPGYSFNGWYLNGIYEGKLSSMPVTISQNSQIIAVFSLSVNYLTLSSNGPGTTNPGGGTLSYGTGSTVTITESPNSGDIFSGWYLDGAYMGTSNSIIVTMNQDHQVAAFFAGNNLSPTPAPTSMPAPTPNPNLISPILQFYCTSLTSNSAFNVEIQGNLGVNGSGLVNAGVYLSYSVTNGNTWQDFAYVQTDSYGDFSAYWMPSVSGNYIIRAVYFGDSFYSGVTQTVNFALTPLVNQNQNVFSVSSNSTVSSLAFSSGTDSLSFSVSGPSGTTGYTQICISKTLLPDVTKLQVTMDSSTISYASYSNGDTWLITIYYHHSSHNIVMALNSQASLLTATPTSTQTQNPTATPTGSPNATPTSTPITQSTPSPTSTVPEFPSTILSLVFLITATLLGTIVIKRKQSRR